MHKHSRIIRVALSVAALTAASIVAKPASAASTGTVSATVTAQSVSVTVTDGSVSYGTLPLNGTKNTTASDLNDLQTATNDGNVSQDLNITSSNATGGTGWNLGTTVGADQYKHSYSTNAGSTYTAMTSSYQSLATGLVAGGNRTFDLKIDTPSSVSDFTQKSITVTVQAVAS